MSPLFRASTIPVAPEREFVLTESSPSAEDTSAWIADHAWLGGTDLVPDVRIEVRNDLIVSVSPDAGGPPASRLRGVVVPGLVNAHSHAFHRLLRGRTHRQGGDFWLWRDRMYEIAASLTPESYERLATAVFVEMAMAGITTVGEFHYLHHQMGGTPYTDHNEMGHALVRAARRAGIRIALLDAGYLRSGFDEQPLHPAQTRFRDATAEVWLDRVDAVAETYVGDPDVVVGLAPHSVRAVSREGLDEVARRHVPGVPLHIHISEQPAENRDCLAATGLTPTGLLGYVGLLGPDTTLVHATHLSEGDIAAIGAAGATVCYCATTERDLADGIGPAARLSAVGTPLCVGTDSHAVIDIFEEARGIELHTRLATGRRGVFSPESLLAAATGNGLASLGFPKSGLAAGSPADFVVIDPDSPRLVGMRGDTALDSVVFAATAADISAVYVAGRPIVDEGLHREWEDVRGSLDEPPTGQ